MLLWRVFDDLSVRARPAVRFTYRAVGSGVGQQEFAAGVSDWGCGDIPMSAAGFKAAAARVRSGGGRLGFTRTDSGVVHVPFLVGTVSVFHSAPGAKALRLPPCLLAKIFSGKITTWDDPQISSASPGLKVPSGQPICVLRRGGASSSTYGLSAYLAQACPGEWATPAAADWPAGLAAVGHAQDNTQRLVDTLAGVAYCIGYAESAQGWDAGLQEVALTNADGRELTAKEADLGAVVSTFAQRMPPLDADWSGVTLVNLPGPATWPIALPTMLYLPTDATSLGAAGQLLRALATHLLSDEVQGTLLPTFGFQPLPPALLSEVRRQWEGLVRADNAFPAWRFENGTQPLVGMAPYIFSAKRGSYTLNEAAQLQKTQDQLQAARGEIQALRDSAAADARTTKALSAAALALSSAALLAAAAVGAHVLTQARRRRTAGLRMGGGTGMTKAVDSRAQAAVGGIV